jgi:subtilisin family serine protease
MGRIFQIVIFGALIVGSLAFAELSNSCSSYNLNWGLDTGTSSLHLCSARHSLPYNHIVKIAVVDTRVEISHEIFKEGMPVMNGVSTVGPASNTLDESKSKIFIPDIYLKHGTHVAGIVQMVTNTALEKRNRTQIIAINGFPNAEDGLSGTIKAFRLAIKSGARIINYSGGGNDISQEEMTVLKEAGAEGVLVVAAAGNDGKRLGSHNYNYYPAGYRLSNVIVVSAVGEDNLLAKFSNYGPMVDVAAPGVEIWSSVPTVKKFEKMNGTSQATAFVTGLAGLLLSQDPTLTPEQTKFIIKESVTKNSKLTSKISSGGTVNADKALGLLQKHLNGIDIFNKSKKR